MLDWWESSQRFKRYINFSEIFTYLSPPVTLKMRSMSPKSNQIESFVLVVYLYISLVKIYPLVQEISYIQDYALENGVKVTQNFTCLKSVTTIYPLKYDEYPSICSRNISILAIKSTFVDWVLTLKMGGHPHYNVISS